MANARSNNVLIIDTAAQFDETLDIESIKVVNGNAGSQTSTIKTGGSSGQVVYTSAVGATSEKWEEVCIRLKKSDAAYVTPGTDCTVYIYLK